MHHPTYPQRRQPLPPCGIFLSLVLSFGRGTALESVLKPGRKSPSQPMVLSSLLAAGIVCEGIAGGG